jgi:hypothetical protein
MLGQWRDGSAWPSLGWSGRGVIVPETANARDQRLG